MHCSIRLAGLLLLAAGWTSALESQAASVVIRNVTVIDVESGVRHPSTDVLVSGDSILRVARTDARVRGARVIDGRGRFLIPGLWDMHAHLAISGRQAMNVLLTQGVTGVRDMGGNRRVLAWRDSIRRGTLVGPRIRAAGRIVESANWLRAVQGRIAGKGLDDLEAELADRLPIGTAADAGPIVDSLVAIGADFIKIRNFPPSEAYGALARTARARGLGIAGHAPIFLAALQIAVDSGFQSIEHGVISPRGLVMHGAFDAMPAEERTRMFTMYAQRGTAWDPTLVSSRARFTPESTLARVTADTVRESDGPIWYTPRILRKQWREQLALEASGPKQDWMPAWQAALRDTREMHQAGVKVVAGTDLGVVTLVPGFSLHDELSLLVNEAGLTPLAALQAATINAAQLAGVPRAGRVVPGALADLVLLEADPLVDIAAARRIVAVVANGRVFTRSQLDALLRAAAGQ